MYEYKHQF